MNKKCNLLVLWERVLQALVALLALDSKPVSLQHFVLLVIVINPLSPSSTTLTRAGLEAMLFIPYLY
jgi:hypothetical protein